MASGLRAFSTRFFGRAADLERLRELFAGDSWLVTIKGPAGAGKTRLARRYADEAAAEPEAPRVFFCDLTEVRDRAGLLRVVAQTLGLPPAAHSHADPDVVLTGRALAARGRILLVLDNCEQIVEDVADALGHWRPVAPEARFLTTSREALRLSGECVHELEPLGLPQEGGPAAGSDAVQLFVDRAALVRPGYELTPAEEKVVGALVRALDGLPLAIELAAARMGLLGAADILAELPRRFDLLAAGPRDAGARQRTLRGALDWSWDLLAPHERAALAQASVFRGGFTLRAAEAVIDLASFAGAPPILDVMQSLYDKSLIRRDVERSRRSEGARGEVADPAVARFTLLESIREFAAEKLTASGARPSTVDRHTEHVLRDADAWGDALLRQVDHAKLELLEREVDNLVAVYERAMASSDVASRRNAVRAAVALGHVFLRTGPRQAHEAILDATLAHAAPLPRDSLVLRLLDQRAHALPDWGQFSEAKAMAAETLAAARSLGDAWLEGRALYQIGFACGQLGVLADAEEHLRGAREAFRRAGNHSWEGIALGGLGLWLNELGRQEEARAALLEALEILRAANDPIDAATVLSRLATIEREMGLSDQALARLEEAIAVPNRLLFSRAATLTELAYLHHERCEIEAAKRRYQEARGLIDDYGDPGRSSIAGSALGALLAGEDRTEEAAAAFASASDRVELAERGGFSDPSPRLIVETHRGQLDLALARSRASGGESGEADRLRTEARRRLDAGRSVPAPGDDLRFAIKLLADRIAADSRDHQPQPSPLAPPGTGGLVIGPRATWFELPDGRRVELGRQRRVRAVLLLLARRRLEAPGSALTVDDILRGGWPGERVAVARAGSLRVYNVLNRLREAGLRSLLRSEGDGYLLDPSVELSLRED